MKILHGTWIPQSGEEFIQQGSFYIWVETTEQKQFRQSTQRHPRQIPAADLATLLSTELGIKPPLPRQIEELISPQYFLLPTVDNQPLPSLELSRYLEEELPESFEFQYPVLRKYCRWMKPNKKNLWIIFFKVIKHCFTC